MQELFSFVEGRLDREKTRGIVAHLLRGCRPCRLAASHWMAGEGRGAAPEENAYDAAFERVTRSFRVREARQVPDEHFEAGDPREIEALISRCWSLRYRDGAEMVRLARLAITVANRLRPEEHEAPMLADLRCRAWAHLGNSLRVVGDLVEAEVALERAAELLGPGSGDPEIVACVYDFQASLFMAQRRFELAEAALGAVCSIHFIREDAHGAGRAMISRGLACAFAGRLADAMSWTSQGLAQIDPEVDPALFFVTLHNQLWFLVECGRFAEARALRETHEEHWHDEGLNGLKVSWLDARIEAGLGELGMAASRLAAVRRGFEEAGMRFRVAIAGLDLAAVLLQLGHTEEAMSEVSAVIGILGGMEASREHAAAALILRSALEAGAVQWLVVQHVAGILRRGDNWAGSPGSQPISEV